MRKPPEPPMTDRSSPAGHEQADIQQVLRVRAEEKIAEIGESVSVCKCSRLPRPCIACRQWCDISELLTDLLAALSQPDAGYREQVRPYLRHLPDCPAKDRYYEEVTGDKPTCTCGLTSLIHGDR